MKICLTVEEQKKFILILQLNSELMHKFVGNVNENNITSIPTDYLKLSKECFDASKGLRNLIKRIENNILKEV